MGLAAREPCLGGAPANFAYITTLMGNQGIVASRVGEDSRGIETLRRMEELGLNIDLRPDRPEISYRNVNVRGGRKWPGAVRNLASGGLGLSGLDARTGKNSRSRRMRFALDRSRSDRRRAEPRSGRFVGATSPGTLKVFDVNLRQSYYSQDVLSESMRLADIVKFNDEELPKIMESEQGHAQR